MEWLTKLADEEKGESEQMEVEIGYQPKMQILMVYESLSYNIVMHAIVSHL